MAKTLPVGKALQRTNKKTSTALVLRSERPQALFPKAYAENYARLRRQERYPTREQCISLLKRYNVTDEKITHMLAVEKMAVGLAKEIARSGYDVDVEAVSRAALLHDIAKDLEGEDKRAHPRLGAEILKKEGMPKVLQNLVALHSLPDAKEARYAKEDRLEAAIVNYADTRLRVDRNMSLRERINDFHVRYPTYSPVIDAAEPHIYEIQRELQERVTRDIHDQSDRIPPRDAKKRDELMAKASRMAARLGYRGPIPNTTAELETAVRNMKKMLDRGVPGANITPELLATQKINEALAGPTSVRSNRQKRAYEPMERVRKTLTEHAIERLDSGAKLGQLRDELHLSPHVELQVTEERLVHYKNHGLSDPEIRLRMREEGFSDSLINTILAKKKE